MFFIDAHCHVNSSQLRADAANLLGRAAQAGVGRMLTAGCNVEDSADAVEFASKYEGFGLYAAIGFHPHDASKAINGLPEGLLKLAAHPRVAAIGESGLDYYYNHSPADVQKNVFKMQIDWALRVNKPLVIHVRNADGTSADGSSSAMDDALDILASFPEKPRLMFHCYAGGLAYLDEMKKLDAYLSIGGPVTWPKNSELRTVAAAVPKERILCETDCPWLPPQPFRGRGKLNEPAYVRFAYETIAKERGLTPDEFARLVDGNAARLFGWEPLYA